jgi:hypothetical protein
MSEGSAAAPRAKYGWPSIAIAIVFGLLYAYVLFGALSNLVSAPSVYGNQTPWALLIVDVALPVVVFVAAFLLGRRQPIGYRVLLFVAGATVLSCATVASIAYVLTI